MNKNWTMKHFLCCIILLLCPVAAMVSRADKDMDEWLDKLDQSLDQRETFDKARVEKIDKLRQQLLKTDNADDGYTLAYSLFNEYKSYCYDSARHYAYDCLNRAVAQQRPDRIVASKNAIAFSLISAGILSEAREVLDSIDRRYLTGQLLADYYEHQCRLWRSMADYVHEEPFYTKYITLSNTYMDSLKQLTPEGSVLWWSYTGSRQMREHQYDEALLSFNKLLQAGDSVDEHMKAMTYAEMAWAFTWLGEEDKAIVKFAQSAIADNESATREITALYHLSRLIYKRGDYERASRYVHQALEDVNFYNSRLRKVEINDILPIIEQDRYDALRSQRNWLFATSALFVLLLVGILWGYWYIHRKNRKLTEARAEIAARAEELQVANNRLMEADKIKTAYIGRSFYSNAEFIEKLEKVYMAIDRKITAKQYDDLRYTLKQSTLNSERESMYESFDETFLKLFPHFVERFNMLFAEGDRKMPPNDHSLTSEMRIFALIRLGINDSERIAKFLDYSVHTVNTYKTRIKNRSTADNDKFESLIMQI